MMANRVLAVLDIGILICKGALERKESRGAHYRKDYANMSEVYNKNYVHQRIDDNIISSWKDVPYPSSRLQKGLEEFERTKNYGHSE